MQKLGFLFPFPAIILLVASAASEEDGFNPIETSPEQYIVRTQHFRFSGNAGNPGSPYSTPEYMYPVYLRITKPLTQDPGHPRESVNASAKGARDDFIVSLSKERDPPRHSRDRKILNSSTKSNKPRFETERVKTLLKPARTTPLTPLKLYLNTLPVTTSVPEQTTLRLPSPDFVQPTVFNVTVTRKRVKPPLPEPLILIQDSRPVDVVYPPTGDKETEESDSEGEEDDLSVEEDEKRQAIEESSEENGLNPGQEEDETESPSSSVESKEIVQNETKKMVTEAVKSTPANKTTTLTQAQNVTSTQDDAKGKSKKKKKKGKGKKKKKAQLHFVPAPLGPKADIMIRLDKVHKNVKDIVSNIKGAFSSYVVQRPYVNFEVYGNQQKEAIPHHVSYFRILPKTTRNRRRRNRVKVRGHGKQPLENKGQGRVLQLPHLLYMESHAGEHENAHNHFPFKDLPPLKDDQILFKEEPHWVKTWDKENEKEFPRWWN